MQFADSDDSEALGGPDSLYRRCYFDPTPIGLVQPALHKQGAVDDFQFQTGDCFFLFSPAYTRRHGTNREQFAVNLSTVARAFRWRTLCAILQVSGQVTTQRTPMAGIRTAFAFANTHHLSLHLHRGCLLPEAVNSFRNCAPCRSPQKSGAESITVRYLEIN